ncbi:MAG: SpoIIE family protein phosphatase, partial [Acidobacteriota bacterium]
RIDDARLKSVLRVGDEVVEVKGVPPNKFPLLNRSESLVPPGTNYTLVIRRDGATQEFTLTTVAESWLDWWRDWAMLSGNFIFVLIGLIVFLLKPEDKQAVLLALMLGTFSGLIQNSYPDFPRPILALVLLARTLGTAFFPLFLHFFLLFPDRLPWLRRFPRLEIWLYAPCALGMIPLIGLAGATVLFNRTDLLKHIPEAAGWIANGLMLAYMIAGFLALVLNYRAANEQARRRLRVVLAGSAIGFLNLMLIFVFSLSGLAGRLPWLMDYLTVPLAVTLPLVPLSFAYAIVRHQVIPVSLIVRRGVRYLLVSRGSILLHAIGVGVVMYFVMDALFYRMPGLTGRAVGVISAIAGIVVWNLNYLIHRHVLAPLIDRHFFRRSYDSRQIMADLADSLRSTTSLSHLCEQVAIKIQTALQTESVTVLLRDEATGDYLSGYACEYDNASGQSLSCGKQFRLPHFAESIVKLQELGEPVEIEPNAANGQQTIEAESLRQMRTALLLPLRAKEGMPGIISLGARLGDLPFSRDDKHLLMSVAGPTTFAIENARLVERMIEQARRREEIEAENEQRAKELEEARQLQLSMLPKLVPQLPGLEIAAYMKTATEVGGDYYDFHLSDCDGLTVAVGDATGHGLKAGTVVTAMKSLFHCFADEPELLPAMNRSSRVLKQMNLRSLYMGLTVIKLLNSRLRITSGGMPPMLIYRAKDKRVEEVLIKAMPLGSVTGYTYRELEFKLACGDVVVMMSDGFPERFNPEGEMFDYERVTQSLAQVATHSPQEIIQHFVNIGDEWADGRPQDDDVTFVVLKVSEICSSEPEMANV